MHTDEVVTAAPRLTRKGQATRHRIAAAAAVLMFERGVAGTSIEDVQAAAEVNPSQIYRYFKDKKSLLKVVIAVHTAQVLGRRSALSAWPSMTPAAHVVSWRPGLRGTRDGVAAGCPQCWSRP